MNKGDFFVSVLLVAFLGFVIYATFSNEQAANATCEEMIALAQTRSDTLVVYGMKPESKFTSCADRLR